ncbi:MAG: biopolymer transporter ExbD [Symbiopectobacterium sp.]
MHDIKVTPFIDVMLVLLIIFMVITPPGDCRYSYRLSGASTAVPQPPPGKPKYLMVKANKQLYIGDIGVSETGLTNLLDEQTGAKKGTTISSGQIKPSIMKP